jgi:hypothetical protein
VLLGETRRVAQNRGYDSADILIVLGQIVAPLGAIVHVVSDEPYAVLS